MTTADYRRATWTFRTVRWEMMLLCTGVRCKWPVQMIQVKESLVIEPWPSKPSAPEWLTTLSTSAKRNN